MADIQHKIPTSLEGVISETAGELYTPEKLKYLSTFPPLLWPDIT